MRMHTLTTLAHRFQYLFAKKSGFLLLSALLFVCLLGISSQAQAQCTETISNNGNRTYTTTGPNQTICVAVVGFSRTIVINHPGCTLNINPGFGIDATATVTLNATATSLTINNEGTMNAALGTFRGGTINNTGTWNSDIDAVTGATTITNSGTWTAARRFNGVAAPLTLTNANGSTWSTTINTSAGSSLDITNNGTWNVGLSLSPGTNRFLNTNTAAFPTLGFNGTSTQLNNQGSMTFGASRVDVQSTATITNSSGATLTTNALSINLTSTLTNAGTVQATTFYNDQGTTTNAGVLRTSVDFFNYSGTVTNTNRIVVAGAFTNNGMFAGPAAPGRGSITVARASTNTGVFGVSGRLDFCDAGNPANGFDTRGGTVGAATTFCSATPLPVTLVSFGAARQNQGVLVKWSTAMEKQNAYFVVERGADAENFQALKQVRGQGNSVQSTHYAFLDEKPLPQLAYYRLRQVDTDGTSTYSSVVVITGPETETTALILLPNPARQQVQVQGAKGQAVQLLDMTGRVLRTQPAAENVLQVSGLKSGLYLVRAGTRTTRLVVE